MCLDRDALRVDVAVLGAGVAGLWLANLLTQRGLSVAVCDPSPLGGRQSIASQGIIHGGAKYALGDARWESPVLAAMPARWRACLAGRGDIDLRGVPLLSERMHLFSTAAAARRLPSGRGRWMDAAQVPPFGPGALMALDDFVIDVPALIRRLAAPLATRLVARRIALGAGRIDAAAVVLAGGDGNATLAAGAGFGNATMRRRPLRQVVVHMRTAPLVYAHCLCAPFGAGPDMTLTSHGNVLYVGGNIAEDGARRSPGEQLATLRPLLARACPDIDLDGAVFHTVAIDRAEPARPPPPAGDAFAERRGDYVLCWPNKLSLVPRLGDLVMRLLGDLQPRGHTWPGEPGSRLRFAEPPWRRPC